jgi:uncharacterized coiled-coil DUF342 family protein
MIFPFWKKKIDIESIVRKRLEKANEQIDEWRNLCQQLRAEGNATPAEVAELRKYAREKQSEIDGLVKTVSELRKRLGEG